MKTTYAIIFLIVLTTSSCGKLTRGKAEAEIKKLHQIPKAENAPLYKRFRKEHQYVSGFGRVCLTDVPSYDRYEKQLLEFQRKGFITLKDDDYFDDCSDRYTNVILTQEGKKDLIGTDEDFYYIKTDSESCIRLQE
ncbi:MAG TPA: hypothetical protein PK431_07705 [Chitinophagales bacterium]|nr:hypothetical protein [Chitinophagales bacterium]